MSAEALRPHARRRENSAGGGSLLTVRLDRRLPDVNRTDAVPAEYDRYGRFAILRSGTLWFAEVASSHPATTAEGFYWALSGRTLFISPRGSTYRWQSHITYEVIVWLLKRLHLQQYEKRLRLARSQQ